MKRLNRTIIAATASLGLLIPIAGCGSIEDKIQEKVSEKIAGELLGGDVDVDTKEGSVSITGDDGDSMTIGGDQLPEDWPSNLPLPKDHQILQVVDLNNADEERQISVVLSAPGEVEDVAAQLREETIAAGYEESDSGAIQQDMGEIKMDMNTFESSTHRVLISVSNMADDEQITVSYGVWPSDGE